MLYPPEGGRAVAYTRVSTAAKWCDDKGGLMNWKASQAMIGLMKSRPLQARVSSIIARTQDDAYRENKGALKEIVETATQVAQASGRADYGTAIHEMAELIDSKTLDWQYVPDRLKGPLEAYQERMAAFTVVDSEVFVTVDEQVNGKQIRIAGSMDRLLHHPDLGVVVADIKTGTDEPKYPLATTTQVAIYARGRRYRDEEYPGSPPFDDGEPNPNNTAWRKPLHPEVSQTVGVLIHCPLELVGHTYVCDLYALPLKAGWESLVLGHKLQAHRRPPALKKLEKL